MRPAALIAGLCLLAACAKESTTGTASLTTAVSTTGATTSTAPEPPPSTAPPVPAGAVGETVTGTAWAVTVHDVADPYRGDLGTFNAPPGRRNVVVDLEVTNLSDHTAAANTASLRLRDAEDNLAVSIIQLDQAGISGFVAPGQSQRGRLVYAVSAEATGLVLELVPDIFASPEVTIALS